MPRDATRSASSDPTNAWVVPDRLRPALAERYGPVYSGAEAEAAFRSVGRFATCGDRVTADALRFGRVPQIAVVDFATRRRRRPFEDRFGPLARRRRFSVRNPPGTLTDALVAAIRPLWRGEGGWIVVEGEEDLGSLALVWTAPLGATVIYGIPGEGASFVRVDRRAKTSVAALLDRMERRQIDRGD
ncbi:MAG: DUF359 domain-containing protein [Thermoplasmata archaeon]